MSQLSCWASILAAQCFVVFCVSGTVGTKIIIMHKNSCLKEDRSFQEINAITTPLFSLVKVYLPPLHIQLELLKYFVKAMHHNSTGFMYLILILYHPTKRWGVICL
jgi:hypothetical protein